MEDRKPDCLVLHGWGINKDMLFELSKEIKFGGEIKTPCLYEIAEIIEDASLESIANEINKTIKKDTILIAWSMGGLIAIQIALMSGRIKGIILLASTPKFINSPGWVNVIDKRNIKDLKNRLASNETKALEYFIGLVAFGEKSVKTAKQYLQQYITNHKKYKTILASWLDEMEQIDLRKEYSSLNIPVLNILGEQDALIDSKLVHDMEKLLPQASHEVIKNCGHAMFINKIHETQKLINWFVNARINQ